MLVPNANLIDIKTNWKVTITDKGSTGRIHSNPCKLNYTQTFNRCQYSGCNNPIRRQRTSGLCDTHINHQHSLFLELHDSSGSRVNAPLHIEIVDKLIDWAKPRNYDLVPLFTDLSFNILGNIPDVSTLAGDVIHQNYSPPSFQTFVNEINLVVDKHLPDYNNSSYQILETKKKEKIPARILALTFAGLILVEEANRGDRWFCRTIRKDEQQTELLGGAMPIGYFAARAFPWGIEIGKAAGRFIQRV